jgi:hypothetical protein
VDQFLSVIVQLQPTASAILLRLLKDHDHPVGPEASLALDPNTFLVRA